MNTSKTSKPSYKTNDPLGWCGNPSRGAAMGRSTCRGDVLHDGKLTLRKVSLNSGGYDSNGTYFGHGEPLFWYASDDSIEPDAIIDGMIRAKDRNAAKALILQKYPDVKFYR